jgi:hypothetical protein
MLSQLRSLITADEITYPDRDDYDAVKCPICSIQAAAELQIHIARRISRRLPDEKSLALALLAKLILIGYVLPLSRACAVDDGTLPIGNAHTEEQIRRQQTLIPEFRERTMPPVSFAPKLDEL